MKKINIDLNKYEKDEILISINMVKSKIILISFIVL